THPASGQSATTSLVLFNGAASSTLFSANGPAYFGATATSSFSSAGVLTLAGLTNSGLGVDSAGKVYAAATSTFAGVLTNTNGQVTVTGGTNGQSLAWNAGAAAWVATTTFSAG